MSDAVRHTEYLMEPLFDRVSPTELAVVASHVLEAPVKVGELARALGIDVVRQVMTPSVSGWIKPYDEASSGFQIAVNKYEIPERQRFTVAHELGHFLLHRAEIGSGVVDSVMYRSNLSSRKESEANRLAAAIIMPAPLVSAELRRLGGIDAPGIVEELAEKFRVSLPAMRIRLGL